jgi:phosphopantetheine--protein transferase-like protein
MAGNKLNLTIKVIEKFQQDNKISLDENFILNSKSFNSLIRDRIIVELSKIDVNWDGETETSILNLLENKTSNKVTISKPKPISSIGIDIQSVSELPKTEDFWNDEFYIKLFSKKEISYALNKKNPRETFAGIYSLKEAIHKSNNNEIISSIKLDYTNGYPQYKNYLLSVSHSGDNAVACSFDYNNIENIFQKKYLNTVQENKKETKKIIDKLVKLKKQQKLSFFAILLILTIYIFINELL